MEKLRISCVPVGNAIQFPVIMHVCVWMHALHTSTMGKKQKISSISVTIMVNWVFSSRLWFSCLLLIRYRHEVTVVYA